MKKENPFSNEIFKYVENFDYLDGRTKGEFYVCNGPDPRTAEFLFRSWIRSHWRKNWLRTSPKGRITFGNWRQFDVASQTVGAEHAYIFPASETLDLLFEAHHARARIREWMETASPADLGALLALVCRRLGLPVTESHWPPTMKKRIFGLLWTRGLPDLREIVGALNAGLSLPAPDAA
jgi:hypothetical protein